MDFMLDDLVPRPPVVREAYARNLRDARLLRRLLKLSEDIAMERYRRNNSNTQTKVNPDGQESQKRA